MSNPTVEVAKKNLGQDPSERTLSTGVKVRVVPVSVSLIMQVQQSYPYPPIPIIKDEEKNQTYQNPDHPEYKKQVEDVDSKRSLAAMDAIIMFGVELVDGIPSDTKWLKRLERLDKENGSIGLDDYDLDDEIDVEFLFKKYRAVGAADFDIINEMVGVSQEGVSNVEDSFQGN